jgi:PAS domain S-box-containing protein
MDIALVAVKAAGELCDAALDPATQAGLTGLTELAAELCQAKGALLWIEYVSGPRLAARVGVADEEASERLAAARAHAEGPAAMSGLASAPIRACDGQVIGGLCVIEPAPALRTSTSPLPALAQQAAALLTLDRRLAAQALREQAARASEAHLRYVISQMPVVMFVVDRDGVFTMSDGGGLAQLGLAPGQAVGVSAYEMYSEVPEIVEGMRQVLADGEPRGWSSPVGGRIYETRSVALRDEAGAIVGLLGLASDVTERVNMEAANQRLQDEALTAQATALAELSTPLIPISNDTVVLPLIGAVDAARVDRVLQTLLEGIATSRARVAIVDVTGVTRIDAAAAASLGQVAVAARLLGAAVVLTGIGPATARALVELDVDLRDVVLRGTLESGIAWALGRS